MKRSLVFLIPALLLGSCSQSSPPQSAFSPSLSVTQSPDLSLISLPINLRAPLPPVPGLSFLSVADHGVLVSAKQRYIFSTFRFKNTSSNVFKNLTFYAFVPKNSLSSTAFSSIEPSQFASNEKGLQEIRATQGMRIFEGELVPSFGNMDYQAFQTCEAEDLRIRTHVGDVLEYGFVAHNVNGRREIAPGEIGEVTMGFVVPEGIEGMTFNAIVLDEPYARVSWSGIEDPDVVASKGKSLQKFYPPQGVEYGIESENTSFVDATFTLVSLESNKRYTPALEDRSIEQKFQDYIDHPITRSERCAITGLAELYTEKDWEEGLGLIMANERGNSPLLSNKLAHEMKDSGWILPTRQVPGTINVWEFPDGSQIPFPLTDKQIEELNRQKGTEGVSAQALTTCPSAGSGPFRRVKTTAGGSTPLNKFAYSMVQVRLSDGFVTMDEGALTLNKKSTVREVPYAYLGGSGGSTEIDAGLLIQGGKWKATALIHRPGSTKPELFLFPESFSYNANLATSVKLEFAILKDDYARLYVNGVTKSVNIDMSAPGFRADGTGNRLKRVVSLAQESVATGLPTEDLKTGAYFSVLTEGALLGPGAKDVGGTLQPISFGRHAWGGGMDRAEDCRYPAKVSIANTGSGGEEVTFNLK
ncbi:MAG: hypothetical protein U0Z75_01560 [Deinococcaceae bacterium]